MVMQLMIVDDHGLVRQGLRLMAEAMGRFDSVVECASLAAAIAQARALGDALGLVMLDLGLPDAGAMEGLDRFRSAYPGIPVLVVSGEEGADLIDDAFAHGARGYVPKNSSSAALRTAIETVLGGELYVPPHVLPSRAQSTRPPLDAAATTGTRLTPRQSDVLVLLARGLANKEIAQELEMSLSTVRVHIGAIFKLLGVENRTQAATSPITLKLLGRSPT